jgi:hypothetical protein
MLALLGNRIVLPVLAAFAAAAGVWIWLTVGSIRPLEREVGELKAGLELEKQVAESRRLTIADLERSLEKQNAAVDSFAERCRGGSGRADAAALRALARQRPAAPADLEGWNAWLRSAR